MPRTGTHYCRFPPLTNLGCKRYWLWVQGRKRILKVKLFSACLGVVNSRINERVPIFTHLSLSFGDFHESSVLGSVLWGARWHAKEPISSLWNDDLVGLALGTGFTTTRWSVLGQKERGRLGSPQAPCFALPYRWSLESLQVYPESRGRGRWAQ